jgi:hypothetical protein
MMNSPVDRIARIVVQHKELIFLFLLTCIFFYPVVVHYDQMIYPPGNVVGNDVTALGSFWRSFFATSIRNGTGIPLWNPYVFSGTPFIGDPQTQMFYPFVWLSLFFNSDLLFGWWFIFDVFLIGAFTFLFARTLTLSKYAALFSAITFMFSATVVLRVYAGHLSILDALVWFPLILLFYERSFTHNRILNGLGAGIAMALMVLSGMVQIALYGMFVCFVYLIARTFFFTTIPTFKDKIKHLAIVAFLSLFLCAAVSAIQILPTWEYSQFSNRDVGVDYQFSTTLSLPASALETLIIPDALGNPLGPITHNFVSPPVSYWEFGIYLGILPLFLVALALIFHRTRYVFLFLFLALFSLLFSFGAYFPLYRIFYDLIPGFSMFRVPARMLFAFTFSLAVIAGFGIDVIFNSRISVKHTFGSVFGKSVLYPVCACIAAASGLILLVSLLTRLFDIMYLMPAFLGWVAFVAVFCIGPVFLKSDTPAKSHINVLKIVVICILILDLFSFGMRFIDTKPPSEVFKNPDFVSVIKNETDPYFRIYDETGLLNQNIAYRNNLFLISGYAPTWLKEYRTFFVQSQPDLYNAGPESWNQGATIKNFDILRFLNVRYIITKRHYDSNIGVSGLECVYDNDSVLVYRLNVTYPRAYLIPVSEFGNDTPLLVQPAQIVRYSPNSIVVNVTTLNPRYLVLSEIYYPGWTARDNSNTLEILRYHDVFRAVYLDPGTHQVSFTYFPRILTI